MRNATDTRKWKRPVRDAIAALYQAPGQSRILEGKTAALLSRIEAEISSLVAQRRDGLDFGH